MHYLAEGSIVKMLQILSPNLNINRGTFGARELDFSKGFLARQLFFFSRSEKLRPKTVRANAGVKFLRRDIYRPDILTASILAWNSYEAKGVKKWRMMRKFKKLTEH